MSKVSGPSTTQRGGPPLILLIDDYLDAREMYSDYMRFVGFRVTACANADLGLRAALAEIPDLILMDAGLPGLSGWDAVRLLKQNATVQRVPVLMLTAHVMKDAREQALAAGADGFIAKPCLPDELVREIRRALEAARVAGKGDATKRLVERRRHPRAPSGDGH